MSFLCVCVCNRKLEETCMFEQVPLSSAWGQDRGPVSISFTGMPPKPSLPLQTAFITSLPTVLLKVYSDGLKSGHIQFKHHKPWSE